MLKRWLRPTLRRQPIVKQQTRYSPSYDVLEDRLTPTAPTAPIIIEPQTNGQVTGVFDINLQTDPEQYFDADSHAWQATNWLIRQQSDGQVVWQTGFLTSPPLTLYRVDFSDGIFVGPRAGQSELGANTNYVLAVRYRDSNFEVSVEATRSFRTASPTEPIPGAGLWIARQGYVVEEVGSNYRLPVNIAFVPNAIVNPSAPGYNPNAPLYYVSELYGSIKVVRVNGTISDYATGLLDYNPTGPISGSGEQGLTGIAIDPLSGDLFVGMLWDNGAPPGGPNHYPKVERLHSTNGGLTMATRTVIKNFQPETQGQSHQISNVTIGPDGKLYVHLGDGFDASTSLNLNMYRGKVLRMNLDGTAPTDNPLYNAADGINARDFVYTYGHRNPFGGAWRAADGKHWIVENGNGIDRLVDLVAGQSYGWAGNDSALSTFSKYVWSPSNAPVNITFVEAGWYGGSLFAGASQGHAYVSTSGSTYAAGPQNRAKSIEEFADLDTLNGSGKLAVAPTTLVKYNGTGRSSVAAIAAGPDGLYFSTLYEDTGSAGPTAPGAKVYRVRFVEFQPSSVSASAGNGLVTLNWTTNSLATSYNLYRKTESGSFVQIATGLTGTSYADSSVTNGTNYTYVVRGVNLGGESQDSNAVTARPQAGTGTPPTVVNPAAAIANPTNPNSQINLSVRGADADEAEANLRYTWATTARPAGSPLPTFTANGTNAAKNVTATVFAAGSYTFQATIADSSGFTATSSVTFNVGQALTSIVVTPASATLPVGASQQFAATARDQFSNNFTVPPSFTWSVDAGGFGSVNTSGLYQAPASGTGSATVRATSAAISGTSSVTVSSVIPGLNAEFFDFSTALSVIPSLTGLTPNVTRTDAQINYPSVDTAWTGLGGEFADTYASRHTGFINIATAGDYTFYLNSDDGSRLWIDGVELINNDGLHGMVELAGTHTLSVGFHAIRVEFFENGGGAGLILSWSGPGIAKQVVPATVLFLTGGSTNQPPTVATPASASPNPTNGTTSLSVLGADDAGETNLTYSWAVTAKPAGAADPTYSVNGTNAAKNTTATFSQAGNYTFQVTITDSGSLSTTANVNVTVSAALTSITVAPTSITLNTGATQQFIATARDQFNQTMSAPITWSIDNNSGGVLGSISASGLYTAPSGPHDSVVIRATSGAVSGTASVTVVPVSSGDGLTAVYFDNINFTGPSVTRIDPSINFDWNTGTPAPAIGADTFSSRWTGQIQPRFTETYTFFTTSDDGVRLWVNDVLILDQWNDHAPTTHTSVPIALTAGVKVNIRMEHYENGGLAVAKLEWQSASQAREFVPQSQLFSGSAPSVPAAPSGLTATAVSTSAINLAWTDNSSNETGFQIERSTDGVNFGLLQTVAAGVTAFADTGLTASTTYHYRVRATGAAGNSAFSNVANATTLAVATGDGLTAIYFDNIDLTGPSVTRIDPNINFDWGGGSPAPAIGVETFSSRWTGQIQPRFSETYTFFTTSDDGVRLWVNDVLIIDQWNDHPPTVHTSTPIALVAGVKYNIRMEHFENGGGAVAKLEWQSGSQAREFVPQSQLFSTSGTPTAPAAPSGLTASASSSSQINLAWTDNSSNETGFQIERSSDGVSFSLLQTVAAGITAFADTGLTAGTTRHYRVRAIGTAGNSAFSNVANATTLPLSAGDGLTATYFDNINFTGPSITRIDPQINYDWGSGSPVPGTIVVDTFSSRWTGQIQPRHGETYTFHTTSDDGVRLWVNDVLIIDQWNDHAPTLHTSTPIALVAGVKYNIRMEHYENGGGAVARLEWQSASQAREFVPQSQLFSSAGPALNFASGFAGATGLTLNGSTAISGSRVQLTNGAGNQAGSVFSSTQFGIGSFTSQFDFQLTGGAGTADGFTFALQRAGATALGPAGGGLGYGPDTAGMPGGIASSLAIKFDLYSNAGEGVNSTGLYLNGAAPTSAGSIDLTPSGVDLHSGNVFRVNVSYSGTNLAVTIRDLTTNATATQNYTIDIAASLGGSTAFVGFTGGTGGLTATQSIVNWVFTP